MEKIYLISVVHDIIWYCIYRYSGKRKYGKYFIDIQVVGSNFIQEIDRKICIPHQIQNPHIIFSKVH